ncbi:hydrolase [Endozoicomonas sp. (ex Bugula neritina AB1)]|nr:hydrolase [Endozoicomonas sp. (ex Bugula neritina AB1)]
MKYNDPQLLQSWEQRIVQYMQCMEYRTDDASHDFSHFQRVWKTASQLVEHEADVNSLVVLAACYFHDIVVMPKNSPLRSKASTLAAEKTEECLYELGFPEELIDSVCHSVKAHSFSAGITPETIEAKIVQDADRMEALGAIGLARCFYTGGLLKQKLFDPQDPMAESRDLNDRQYSLDHFESKLLKLSGTMQTQAGKAMAEKNSNYLREFRAKLLRELDGDYS